MVYAILSLLLIGLVYFPSLWVRLVMRKHAKHIDATPGTGGELAEHLIERFELQGVTVERLETGGDHYDPSAKAVRLSADNYDGKSLTAVAVAAHEVGHAIQFDRQETVSRLRSKYIPMAMLLKKTGILLVTLVPLVALVIKVPSVMFALIGLSLALQMAGALAYLIVLPEEWDASFNKAMPVLAQGYVPAEHLPAARSVLKAAALMYFAGALADVVNIGRWLVLLRR